MVVWGSRVGRFKQCVFFPLEKSEMLTLEVEVVSQLAQGFSMKVVS